MAITALPTPPSRDDAANFSDRADAFLGALPTFVTEANALAADVSDDADAAAAAAASAVATPNTQATSTTSLSITIASKTLTIETGKTIVASMWVAITSSADGTKWMAGPVTSYDSGTGQLIVNVQRIAGSGTLASWTVVGVSPMIADTTPRNLAAGSTVKDAGGTDQLIGFRGAPVVAVAAAHVLGLADVGCTLEIAAGGSITVPLHATTAFNPGDIVILQNMTSSTKSITPASGVALHQEGTTNTGARTLKAWGQAMIRFTGTTDVVICGGSLT